jgi:hypothetical protein
MSGRDRRMLAGEHFSSAPESVSTSSAIIEHRSDRTAANACHGSAD